MESKVSSRCDGVVQLEVIRHEKGGASVVGTCQQCGATYDEAAVLKLKGPGPVGG
jgi:hypothetical protein